MHYLITSFFLTSLGTLFLHSQNTNVTEEGEGVCAKEDKILTMMSSEDKKTIIIGLHDFVRSGFLTPARKERLLELLVHEDDTNIKIEGDVGIGPIRGHTVYILEIFYKIRSNVQNEKKRALKLIKTLKDFGDFEEGELEEVSSYYELLDAK